jgi:hypothetical protein
MIHTAASLGLQSHDLRVFKAVSCVARLRLVMELGRILRVVPGGIRDLKEQIELDRWWVLSNRSLTGMSHRRL